MKNQFYVLFLTNFIYITILKLNTIYKKALLPFGCCSPLPFRRGEVTSLPKGLLNTGRAREKSTVNLQRKINLPKGRAELLVYSSLPFLRVGKVAVNQKAMTNPLDKEKNKKGLLISRVTCISNGEKRGCFLVSSRSANQAPLERSKEKGKKEREQAVLLKKGSIYQYLLSRTLYSHRLLLEEGKENMRFTLLEGINERVSRTSFLPLDLSLLFPSKVFKKEICESTNEKASNTNKGFFPYRKSFL